MTTSIIKVETTEHLDSVVHLAEEIWHQHFTPIIGRDQVLYMLKKFQSAEAIAAQLERGAEYYLALDENRPCGYTGIQPDVEKEKLMLSKLYVREAQRSHGLGTQLLDIACEQARTSNMGTLWLTVNRYNRASIDWYQRRGFKVVNETKFDIGNGFFMDDFIMEKAC